MTDKKPSWRKPQQARSIARFNHILDTAATLYAAHGYENVTTNHIADAAEVSVGGLYRFFPNKEAIVEALVERYVQALSDALPQVRDTSRPMSEVVREMLTGMMHFDGKNALFHQMMSASQPGFISHAATQMHDTMRDWVEVMLGIYHPTLSANDRHLCAAAGMGIVKGMLTMMQPPDAISPEVTMNEIIATLMAYVADFVLRKSEHPQ